MTDKQDTAMEVEEVDPADEEYVDPDKIRFDEAKEAESANPDASLKVYISILNSQGDEEGKMRRVQEQVIFRLCEFYSAKGDGDKLVQLLKNLRPRFEQLPKAKTAKIVRTVIDKLGLVPNTESKQVELCHEYIQWCIQEKRAFLRQRIQTKLAALLLKQGDFQSALQLLAELQLEVKKLDDKQLLVEIFLIESWANHALRNLPKAKASLTAARSAASSIYVGPQLQTEIDMQGGKLNADEKDFRTGYSYFFEAFEGFDNLQDMHNGIVALKYMLLCKIMHEKGDEVPALLNSKKALKYSGRDVDSLRAIAKAYKDRSLKTFEKCLSDYKDVLMEDKLIQRHLTDLQGGLLEKNLCRIIEPFSKVEISRVAQLIDMPVREVENKLSQMILDKKFKGILDQGTGQLIVFDEEVQDKTYENSLASIQHMGTVVDSLFRRAQQLNN